MSYSIAVSFVKRICLPDDEIVSMFLIPGTSRCVIIGNSMKDPRFYVQVARLV
jgi:hypothetical protein